MTRLLLLFLATISLFAMTADKPAYVLYNRTGQPVSYAGLLNAAAGADVVLFGELHNNPICHWLQLELSRDLFARRTPHLIIGGEMFEADNQLVVSEFIEQKITPAQLKTEARVWPNYDTDYEPILSFCRQHNIPFIATNVPRRYASLLARQGPEALNALSAEARRYMAPLPLEVDLKLPGYAGMLAMSGPHGSGMRGENMARAQALKDATMAYFIVQNLKKGQTFLHLNGSYHSEHNEGIGWYLRRQRPDLKIVSIATQEAADPARPDSTARNLADFVLTVPSSMTKTH